MTNSTMKTTRLISNIESVKAEKMDAKSKEISIVVKTDDLKNGVQSPVFYPSRWGMEYDTSDFRPIGGGGNVLPDFHKEEYYKMLDAARNEYKKMLESRGNNSAGSAETEELKKSIADKETRIAGLTGQVNTLTEKIKELEKSGAGNEAAQLKTMIEELKTVYENRIEITINGETKIVKKDENKVYHPAFKKVLLLVTKHKKAVYMYGPAGTGKSELAEQIADAAGLDFYPASTLTEEYKFTGYRDMAGLYHDTNFRKAVENGGLFFLDEMDACVPEVLIALNGLLANNYFDFPDKTVKAHDNFRCIAAGNTIGRGGNEQYRRYPLDMSTMNRFVAIKIEYSAEIDTAIAKNDQDLVNFAHEFRKAVNETNIAVLMSYRDIKNIIELSADFDLVEVMDMTLIKGMPSDDMTMLADNMNCGRNNKYFTAFKKAAVAA